MTARRFPGSGWRAAPWAGLGLAAAGCSGAQSALDPAGVQAGRISGLWWLYCVVCVAVYLVVMALLAWAVLRRNRPDAPDHPVTAPPEAEQSRLAAAVTGGVSVTAVLLFVLLLGDFLTGRGLNALADPDALTVQVTAHQWWWEVRYQDPEPAKVVTTANEIHVPVGRPVLFELRSPDVIHSFWVPNLHGKKDVIPGHPTRLYLRADRAGTYWGQCAEYCGHQHATMRFAVVAEPADEFGAWLEGQRRPGAEPATERQRRGQQVFLGTTCVTCHTVQGTPARALVGPDLTHLAGRRWIASGTLDNTRGHLAGWVVDPQRIRPGVRMPLNPLKSEDLQALLDYLEGLK